MNKDHSSNFVLCALAQHYIEGLDVTIKELHSVLNVNGKLIISIEHPFFQYNNPESQQYFKTEAYLCNRNLICLSNKNMGNENQSSDKILVAKTLNGNIQAFAVVVKNTEKLVAQIVRKMTANEDDHRIFFRIFI